LIDVSRYDAKKIGEFKFLMWEKFGIDSAKYEHIWDYEQYMRLAQPAVARSTRWARQRDRAVRDPFARVHGHAPRRSRRSSTPASNFRTIFYATKSRRCGASSKATPATTRCSTT
jgi:hypothetical protein